MIALLALLLHALLMVQAAYVIGEPQCGRRPFVVNRRRMRHVIETMPETGRGAPALGDLGLIDTENFVRYMPAGHPYHLPAIFETANGDAQVVVKVEGALGINLINQIHLGHYVWPYARQMAKNIHTKCRTATLGRTGHSTLNFLQGPPNRMHMTLHVSLQAQYTAESLSEFFYSAGNGPGPPIFVHH